MLFKTRNGSVQKFEVLLCLHLLNSRNFCRNVVLLKNWSIGALVNLVLTHCDFNLSSIHAHFAEGSRDYVGGFTWLYCNVWIQGDWQWMIRKLFLISSIQKILWTKIDAKFLLIPRHFDNTESQVSTVLQKISPNWKKIIKEKPYGK